MLKRTRIQPMHARAASPARSSQAVVRRERWRVTLVFALMTVSILIVLWPTTRSMIEIWQRSSTYGHCYAVIPIAVWLAWRQSASLVAVPAKPFWPGLALIFAIGLVWLLGELASAAVVTQFAAVSMIAATALTAFGWQWTRQLAFPLEFLFFSVPAGEELLPVLMEWTADVTVAALRMTGIPVIAKATTSSFQAAVGR